MKLIARHNQLGQVITVLQAHGARKMSIEDDRDGSGGWKVDANIADKSENLISRLTYLGTSILGK